MEKYVTLPCCSICSNLGNFAAMNVRNFFIACTLFVGIGMFSCKPFKNVTSIKLVYDSMAEFRPGGAVKFGVKTLDRRGRRKGTRGYAAGKMKFEQFDIRLTGGWQSADTFQIDTFVEPGVNKAIKIAAYVTGFPKLADSVELPLSYMGETRWNFSGAAGQGGKDGKSRILPARVDGTAVSDGKPGKDGLKGGNGHDLDVYIKKITDEAYKARFGCDVIAVKVYDRQTKATKFTYISELSSKMSIISNGGAGGEGGDGGPGSDGRDGDDLKNPGNGTDGGIGGKGGNGGDGGKITIYIATEEQDLLKYFVFTNNGGAGGKGGIGGIAGRGGVGTNRRRGNDGRNGFPGSNGTSGNEGGKPQVVFGPVGLY